MSFSDLKWTAKAEPFSPFSTEDNWLIDDDLALNKDIYTSLPLSLIQQDKEYPSQLQDELYSFAQSQSTALDFSFHYESRSVPSVKQEEESDISPPDSPRHEWAVSSSRSSRAQLASKLLNELEQCKEEPFSSVWMEEKVDLPIFDEYSVPHEPIQDTQTLIQEFENVCGAVGIHQNQQDFQLHHLTHLTPPQSPPFHQTPYGYQPAPLLYPTRVPSAAPIDNWQPDILDLEQQNPAELARELAVVEELVLHRAQDVNVYETDIKLLSSPVSNESDTSVSDYYQGAFEYSKDTRDINTEIVAPPPEHTYAKSVAENNIQSGPLSPNSSSSCSMYGSDDDWGPSSSSSSASISGRQKSYTRSKPYSRNPDDKRSRKKEQNKNAATRYRQKKKQEVEVLAGEEKELKDIHDELEGKCADLQREVKYLKGLMRELCRAKGLIK